MARKPFLLRIDSELLDALQRWADEELRSLNGQIEYILRAARALPQMPTSCGFRYLKAYAMTSNRATVMTLRVKKSEVDALAAGKLSQEQFASEAETATYLNPLQPKATFRSAAYESRR